MGTNATQHTPGPWLFDYDEDEGFSIRMATAINGRGRWDSHHKFEVDFSLYPDDGEQFNEAEANFRLMAAAPDLLAALRGLMDNSSRADWPIDLHDAAEAAIKKATQP